MTITPHLFEAFLKCPTKCWLKFTGEPPAGNAYAEWVQTEDETYRNEAAKRLTANLPAGKYAALRSSRRKEAHYSTVNLKTAKWRLAVDVPAHIEFGGSQGNEAQTSPPENSQNLLTSAATIETCLHAVERIPSAGRGRPAQFIPIRFIHRNKLTKDDKLLLAFDAFVLSETLGRAVSLGKIIHGDDHATLKVKTPALAGEVRKCLGKITALLASPAPPDLVLNRHCAECEFQARCRKLAVEKDDLSLLAGMSAKERQKLRSKGIFTINQLSYAFLPRRRPKWLREKREKYHHSLKALAIREQKTHIVGSPKLKLDGTPVYLDVEGLPDRDFYYLIGMRIGHGDSAVQHSLWADTVADEGKIWREFLALLEAVEQPVLVHYGSYETEFLERMREHYGSSVGNGLALVREETTINILSSVLGQVYFPTYSNGLKEIGGWLGFVWPDESPIGVNSVACRSEWEGSRNSSQQARLVAYNAADCHATELVTQALMQLNTPDSWGGGGSDQPGQAVYVESLRGKEMKWGAFVSEFKEFEQIALAAWWNYQRDRIYVKSTKPVGINLRRCTNKRINWKTQLRINKSILCPKLSCCPFCAGPCVERSRRRRILYDLLFCRSSVKRWVVEYRFRYYWCDNCHRRFGEPREF